MWGRLGTGPQALPDPPGRPRTLGGPGPPCHDSIPTPTELGGQGVLMVGEEDTQRGIGKGWVGGPTGQTPPVWASLQQIGPLPPGSLEGASTPGGEKTGTAGHGQGRRGWAPLQVRKLSRVRAEGSRALCCEWGPQGWQGAARRPQALPDPSLGPLLLCRIVAQPPSGAESRAWALEGEGPRGPAWHSTRAAISLGSRFSPRKQLSASSRSPEPQPGHQQRQFCRGSSLRNHPHPGKGH